MSPRVEKQQRRGCSRSFLIALLVSLLCAVYYGRHGRSHVSPTIVPEHLPATELDWAGLSNAYANETQLLIRDDYSCTKDQPCQTKACCGGFFGGTKGTRGFGPNFCGNDCTSNCEAKSECGINASPAGKTCPLNVCCSEFGFCGTTSDFCGKGCQSNCGAVQVPDGKADGGVLQKLIGYYEAWQVYTGLVAARSPFKLTQSCRSARWTCHAFPPSAIPVDGLTHVNFAFAGIDPDTFQVTTMDAQTPESLFMETADVATLKSGNQNLQVFASIGGWTFSDNDTKTQPVFGNIAKDGGNRQKFASNVVSFMKEYGFDGIDIDWEYPGSPDRGGHLEDTENYVALMKTLKTTFDQESKGKYGLTFTVPTSYWYLRWFDLPGMLKYADWVNMMTYDLHGAWDMDNPIGNIVQGHTNLTEIKQSVELLWRNNVQPKQVVLGFGFYGRAFQLDDASCSKTGCKFKDAAAPGPCTKGAGTPGYFEIQDIIADQKPDIVHDKDAAVNYFAYSQTNSKEKRSINDNDVGKQDDVKDQLGGSMVWSVDQDDETFSALQGLTGKNLTALNDELQKSQVTDTGHWASLNGQKCKLTDCHKDGELKCDAGWASPPGGGDKFKDNCGGVGNRIVCCPVDSMPNTCQWRGGESGRSCHGQCHTGESTLFHSRHATVDCYRPGFQAFCCEATSFQDLIDSCKWTQCLYPTVGVPNKDKASTVCGAGTTKVASKFDFIKCQQSGHIGQNKDMSIDLCCPSDSAFGNCHWVGQGTCDDNECSATDVQVDTDPFGDGGRCAGGANGRSKSLCCNTPKNLNPFLPASLDNLFPTKPPEEDLPKYDVTILGDSTSGGNDEGPNNKAFAFLVLDGPSGAVQTLRKRDGSHWHVVSCESMQASGATLQIVSMNHDENSNCRDIYEDGIEGTIVAMPDDCGPGTYAVVHSILPSISQTLPAHVRRDTPQELYDIELSYDFSLAKRDAGDIFIRLDYSNIPGYFENVVQADHAKRRSLDKRFWSVAPADWKQKIDNLRSAGLAKPTMEVDDVNALLIGAGKQDQCKADDDDGFLSVKVTGKLEVRMRFGYTYVGTLSPDFHIEEAYGFFDSAVEHDGTLEFDGRGKVAMHGEAFQQKSILPAPLTNYLYNHPGIVSLAPQFDVFATLIGDGEIDGKFSAEFNGGNGDTFTTYNQPKMLGDPSGETSNLLPDGAFQGEITSNTSSVPSRKAKRAISGDTIFGMSLFYKTMMGIDLYNYGTSLDNANITMIESVDSYIRLQGSDDGTVLVTSSNQEAAYEYELVGQIDGWQESTDTILLPDKGTVFSLYQDNKPPAKRNAPNIEGKPIFDSDTAMQCTTDTELKCLLLSDLVKYDPSLLNDPETGQPYDEDGPGSRLAKRAGGSRPYKITTNTGTFIMRSPTDPAGANGDNLEEINADAGHYGGEDSQDCENSDITDDYQDTNADYVTEHILELNYFPNFIQFAITGEIAMPGVNTPPYRTQLPTVDENILNPQGRFSQDYQTWDTALGSEHPGSPLDRIWQVFGSRNNPHNLVNAERVLNGIKARVWVGDQPMSNPPWDGNGWNRAGTTQADFDRAEAAISYVNAVMMVIAYLNNARINQHLGDSTTDMQHELETFSDRYNANFNADIDLGSLHRDYIENVLLPRLGRFQDWVQRRLTQLHDVWSAEAQANPQNRVIQQILLTLTSRSNEAGGLTVDRSRMPGPP